MLPLPLLLFLLLPLLLLLQLQQELLLLRIYPLKNGENGHYSIPVPTILILLAVNDSFVKFTSLLLN